MGHVEAIQDLREPGNVTELLRFIGLRSFFGAFIPDFSQRARSIYVILKGSGFNEEKKYRKQIFFVRDCPEKWGKIKRMRSWT